MSEMWDKLLKQLGHAPRARPAAKPLPYRAVSVAPTRASCPAAVAIRNKRFLAADAPTLPLPMCTWPLSCPCKLKSHDDRRARPRQKGERDEVRQVREERQPTNGRRPTGR